MADHTQFLTRLAAIQRFVETLPDDFPAPFVDANLAAVTVGFWYGEDTAVKVRDLARYIGGRWHKNDPSQSTYDGAYYVLTHDVQLDGGVAVRIICSRDEVCERVAVRTETVKVAAQPAVEEHEEERTVYEFRCTPLNAKANALTLDDELAELTA